MRNQKTLDSGIVLINIANNQYYNYVFANFCVLFSFTTSHGMLNKLILLPWFILYARLFNICMHASFASWCHMMCTGVSIFILRPLVFLLVKEKDDIPAQIFTSIARQLDDIEFICSFMVSKLINRFKYTHIIAHTSYLAKKIIKLKKKKNNIEIKSESDVKALINVSAELIAAQIFHSKVLNDGIDLKTQIIRDDKVSILKMIFEN